MNSSTQRLVASVLVVLYGGVTLLDQGLHLLVPHSAHSLGMDVVEWSPTGDHAVCHGICCPAGTVASFAGAAADGQNVALGSRDHDELSHPCAICEYLAQARSGQLQCFTAIDWRPLVTVTVVTDERHETQAVLGPYAPRGPPLASA